eukprot:CAMPEP_0198340644 /NCGR_PEP_ID=MMETSP1450-20131203/45633_1 /TAXON_ID=753684 ORGANISM="Madagascaria erythrocladiodes, Strain CCMP3234" /NCGR_SAMPLE_ID=MMETSP1450 /ASSEMBLY_ACC=CAM_ASM_001115 /LENGTH=360 /DNA_ID=CAMNT_0044045633 /DNA_START=28 /DNA_END=1106 /DNA_ORIENTATION=-
MSVIKSPYGEVEVPDVSVTDFVLMSHSGDEALKRVAMVNGNDGTEVTMGELQRQVRQVAGALVASGLKAGDVVAVVAPNSPTFAVFFHAVLYAGGTVSPCNPSYGAEELQHQFKVAKAVRFATVSALKDTVVAARKAYDAANESVVVLLDDADKSFSALLDAKHAPLDAQVAVPFKTHVAALPFSSGTTGLSKGVMLSHYNLVANVVQMAASGISVTHADAYVAVLPFFHIYGLQVLLNGGLRMGAKVVTMARFDLPLFLTLMAKHACTWAFLVPPIVLALAKHPLVAQHDLSALKVIFSGAAPLGPELQAQVEKRLPGVECAQGYGMTELSPVSHSVLTKYVHARNAAAGGGGGGGGGG